jgi:2-phospho-L-lactate guanylyltransferase (CobY/MobA/RfbA family)
VASTFTGPSIYALAKTTVVVPFAGPSGKTRLRLSARARRELARAMLGDVLAACVVVGPTRVPTPDSEGGDVARDAGAEPVGDPGGACLAGLDRGGRR